MRYGIRDFLLVIGLVVGGLALSPIASFADEAPAAAAAGQDESAEDGAAEDGADSQPADPEEKPAAEETPAAESQPAAETAPDGDAKAATEHADPDGAHQVGGDAAKAGDGHAGAGDHGADHGGDDHAGDGHAGDGHGGGDHGGEHHDPYDLSHINASEKIADASEIKSDLALWTLVVFLCLLALLAKFAWGPIMEGLERREASIAAAIEEAEQAAAKGAEQLQLYEAKLAAAAEETREMLAAARKDAEATGERIVAEAHEAAQRERDKAVADIAAAKNAALADITERSVDLAVSMAGRMIQRQLTPDDRQRLMREALDQLPSQN